MAENGRGEADGAFDVSDISTQNEESSRAQANGKGKMHGVMKSFKGSIKRAGEKSPLSLKYKISKSKEMGNSSDSQDNPPPSPNLSIGSTSPSQRTNDPLQSPQNQKHQPSHSRTQSDSVVVLGDGPTKKRESSSFRLGSFRLGSKKEKTGTQAPKQEQLEVVTEILASAEEQTIEVAAAVPELKRSYKLPEIPPAPLSVMQINKLIEMEVLEEAYVNLLSLRLEFQCEREALGQEDSTVELAHKEKDLSLLYKALRTKLTDIVRHSCALPSRNKELLVHIVCIIQEEEKREGDLVAMGGWREAWRDAVREGMRDTIKGVHLDSYEQNISWLAMHLGLLGKAIVEDLEKVKSELVSSYPPSFNVFETYVSSCHKVVGEHLKGLLGKVTEMKDFHALLDFIIHRYPSEKVMGSISLQPELKEDQRTLKLDEHFLDQIKTGYCGRVQADMRSSLDNIIELEHEEMWKDERKPEIDENLYNSHIHMDIWTNIKGKAQATRRLDENLEQKVICACLEELKQFPKRFESAFVQWSNDLLDTSLWTMYHITYINSFSALKEHMEGYRESCPQQMEELCSEVGGLLHHLTQNLLDRFKTDVKPFLRRMLTRKWLSSDEDFKQLANRIETLSQQCKHMSLQHAQGHVGEVHYFVVKEYISQLMKNNYSCKNRKNERAANKMSEQWGELQDLFQEMNSAENWLYPVGDHLSKIVGERNKSEIKNHLQPLLNDYPDVSKKHLSAVLYFRGMTRGRERQVILQKLSELKQPTRTANTQRSLFSEIQPAVNTDCSQHHDEDEAEEESQPVGVCPKGKMTPPLTGDRDISSSKYKFPKFRKVNIPFFKKTSQLQNDDTQCVELLLNFKENLKEKHFAAAEKQLINREERLFSVKQGGVGCSRNLVEEEEDHEEHLKKDFEDLLKQVWSTVEKSFSVQTDEEIEALKQAVLVIQQEEEQDRRWEGVSEKELPPWRPRCCRRTHDSRLHDMVKMRMEEAKLDSNTETTTSIQKEVIGKGKQIKEDLLHVARNVKSCYTEENVCQLYAEMYHQTFSAKLREITEYGLSDDDGLYVLQWVNMYYPSILRHEELTEKIKYEELTALLPENMLKPLEEQFFAQKENELQKWCQNILTREKDDPELRDGCYFSPLAIDVIQCIHSALKSAQEVLGSCSKAQSITHQFQEFLTNYQDFLKNIIEDNQANTDAVLKANLVCIRQIREYITKNQEVFPVHIKNGCMRLLTSIRQQCHDYFTKAIHRDLKGKYAKLGTREWLKHSTNVCDELLEGVDTHIQKLTTLDNPCLKELLSQLHKEVLVEYVRKLMKKKIKLGDEKKQQQAVAALHDNSQKIHTLFTEAGSVLEDLKDILPKLAELLTIKDPLFVKLGVATLAQRYPDFSEAHVCAWLYLRANLTNADLRKIRNTFSEIPERNTPDETDSQDQDPLYSSRNFFSKVLVK